MTKHNLPLSERFFLYVDKTPTCWNWTGGKANGYGMFQTAGRKMRGAHRVSYEMHLGEIPDGMQVDHMCRVRECVNPDHLRLVTIKQNSEHQATESSLGRSGYRGVQYLKHTGTWAARVRHNGKIHSAGSFHSIEEAAAAVRDLRLSLQTHNLNDQRTTESP